MGRVKQAVMEWEESFPPLNLINFPNKMISEKDIKDYNDLGMKQPSGNPDKKTLRQEILDEANSIVNGARANTYGGPEDSFKTIAALWSVYLKTEMPLMTSDVAVLLALLKIARLQNSPGHRDSWVDLAGYAACGAECGLK